MAFFRPLQDLDKPNLGEEYYHAIVVDNNDPDRLKRVKIRIEEIHGTSQEIPDANLPWAIQFRPTFLGGDTELSTSAVPRVGSSVIVTHIRGQVYQPAYMFELSHNANRIAQGEESYPDSYVFKDSDENYYHVDMQNDVLDIKFNGSETLQITVDRTSNIDNNDTRIVGGDDTETVTGNQTNTISDSRTTDVTNSDTLTVPTLTINASSAVTINSPAVNVNSGTVTVSGGDVIADGISLKTHVHSQGGDNAGDAQVNTNPPV